MGGRKEGKEDEEAERTISRRASWNPKMMGLAKSSMVGTGSFFLSAAGKKRMLSGRMFLRRNNHQEISKGFKGWGLVK
jgi:hypothetical protein